MQAQRARFDETKLSLAAIAIDGPETAAQIPSVARRLKLAFPILHDADSTVSSRLNPQRSVPFLIAIDRTGKVVHERSVFSLNSNEPSRQKSKPSSEPGDDLPDPLRAWVVLPWVRRGHCPC